MVTEHVTRPINYSKLSKGTSLVRIVFWIPRVDHPVLHFRPPPSSPSPRGSLEIRVGETRHSTYCNRPSMEHENILQVTELAMECFSLLPPGFLSLAWLAIDTPVDRRS